MKASKIINIATLGIMALSAESAISADRMINGADNRLDVIDVTNDMYLKVASATAVLTSSNQLTKVDNGYDLKGIQWSNLAYDILGRDQAGRIHVEGAALGRDLPNLYNTCADEPFRDQVLLGHCSGFLVGADTFVTAGHCVTSVADCADTKIVFDYNTDIEGASPSFASDSNVYSCKSIVSQALEKTTSGEPTLDYAVIKLDRPVVGREPLKVRQSGSVSIGDPLVMIGGPLGLPTKVDDGAAVAANSNPLWFEATTDSYGGNSGSVIINADTGEVEGILVRGGLDLTFDVPNLCVKSYVCEGQFCGGESVSRSSQFVRFL